MTKRLFTGFKIDPGPGLLMYYQALQKELKEEAIKWVETENLHITLWFFGDTETVDIPIITNQLKKAGKGISPFTVDLVGCGLFGPANNPSVIWAGIEIPEMLLQLYHQIRNELFEVGIQSTQKEYRPHLTLGRIKRVKDMAKLKSILRTLKDLEFQQSTIDSYCLYESKLSPSGPLYLEIEKFDFKY